MNFCGSHNTAVQKAITERGMWGLVATDVKTVTKRAQLWLTGKATASDFDPLVIATLELLQKTREHAGLPGNKCPLCFASHHLGKGIDNVWINGCTDKILDACKSSDVMALRAGRKVNGATIIRI